MSQIVVSGAEVNMLVLKYLLEAGYKHTAFALEHEAGVSLEEVLAKKLPPRLLVASLEQALLLRYLEAHGKQPETQLCAAPFTLLGNHHCQVVDGNFLGKRQLIREANIEIAKEISESLVQIDQAASLAMGPLASNEAKLKPKPATKTGRREADDTPRREKEKIEKKEPKEADKKEKEADKILFKKPIVEEDTKPADQFERLEAKEVPAAFSYELVESYFDGLSTYLLLKVREGTVACYMVTQLTNGEARNMFILPTEYLSQGSASLHLRKHLILCTTQGEICFVNYRTRALQAKVTFSLKPPKSIVHDPANSVYLILCERKAYVVDDLTFNLKRELPGAFELAAAGLGGKVVLLGDNSLNMVDLEDKTFSLQLAVGESKVEAVKFSSLGLYLTAKLAEPHGVGVWMLDKAESLFTFNENQKFADFLPIDTDAASFIICYDEDYIKVWNVSYGRLKRTLDYSRKKVGQVISLKDGRLLAVKTKKDKKVTLIDIVTDFEKTIYDGDEETTLVKLREQEFVLLKPGALVFYRLPVL